MDHLVLGIRSRLRFVPTEVGVEDLRQPVLRFWVAVQHPVNNAALGQIADVPARLNQRVFARRMFMNEDFEGLLDPRVRAQAPQARRY